MDKKGQTLIVFVILIPIIITMIAIVVDVGLLTHEFEKARGLIDTGIELYFEKGSVSEIENLLKMNDIPVNSLKIEEQEDAVEVSITYSIDALFGQIINIHNYPIEMHRRGTIEKGKINIRKG